MLHEVSFKSFNERDMVQGWVYVPACEPKGIIQLVHGFGEHSRRYFHMIVAFMDAGFIVAADDHVGHGKTAVINGTWGEDITIPEGDTQVAFSSLDIGEAYDINHLSVVAFVYNNSGVLQATKIKIK